MERSSNDCRPITDVPVKQEVFSGSDDDADFGEHVQPKDPNLSVSSKTSDPTTVEKVQKKKRKPRKLPTKKNDTESQPPAPRHRKKRLRNPEALARQRVKERLKRAAMTPEELEKWRERRRQRNRQRRAEMTPEQLEARREKSRQRNRQKRANMTPEELEQSREAHRMQLRRLGREAKMTFEERKFHRERDLQEGNVHPKMRFQKILTDEEVEDRKQRKRFYHIMKRAMMTPEDKARLAEYQRNYQRGLTGDNKDRWVAMRKRAHRKRLDRAEDYLKFLEYQKQRMIKETPEKRQKRLLKYKINQARRKLKKKLEEDGVSAEEIDRRVDILVKEMEAQPQPEPSMYRPRAQTGEKSRKLVELEQQEREMNRTVTTGEVDPTRFGEVEHSMEDTSCPDFPDGTPYCAGNNVEDRSCQVEKKILINYRPKKPLLTCQECQSTFSRKDDLITHLILFHPENCWKCPTCSEVMLTPHELSEHFKRAHPAPVPVPQPSNLILKNDSKTVKAKVKAPTQIVLAVAMPKPVLRFNCLRCDRKFKTLRSLSNHVRIKHHTSYWPCEHCRLLKYSESSLAFHRKVCLGLLKII